MRKSIRLKLFLVIVFIVVLFVLLSWILNIKYLEGYYVEQKKVKLIKVSEEIDKMYMEGKEDISLDLEKIERNNSININIIHKNLKSIEYNGSMRGPAEPEMIKRVDPSRFVINKSMDKLSKGTVAIQISKDPRISTNFINLIMVLNNGNYLLLSTPLAAIKESTQIANRFFIYTGLLTIIVGSIMALIFSRRFTHPILELNSIAQKMAKLDFSNKYKGDKSDEIGELGNNINSLSEQLDKSISELQEANEKLKEDIEKERRIDEMRKELVYSVSHELKTPISLIQGYAEGLKVNVVEDEENKNFYCEVIVDESRKMDKLVKDLLDLSQIESGYYKLDKIEFDISRLIEKVIYKYEPIFKEKDIRIDYEKCTDCLVYGDITRIEQILVNYINNAINHVDDNKLIRIKTEELNKKIRISVFNSGRHIEEEYMDKIWLSFYKIDKARTRSYGGTGLGLSIVRVIQELHNNSFGVENKDNGVVFWFDIDMNT